MSGNINFNGWINDDGSENYKCRAWVNFNGTGTVAIRASGNVSSITDNGTGDYTVNFTTAMPDANYATLPSVEETGILVVTSANSTFQQTASAARIGVYLGTSNTKYDPDQVNVSVFR
jgi:hypothetical protein